MEGTNSCLPAVDNEPAAILGDGDGQERALQEADGNNNGAPSKRPFLKRGEGVYRRVYAKKFKQPKTQSSSDASPVAHRDDAVFEGRSTLMATSRAEAPYMGNEQPLAPAPAYSYAPHPATAPQAPVADPWGELGVMCVPAVHATHAGRLLPGTASGEARQQSAAELPASTSWLGSSQHQAAPVFQGTWQWEDRLKEEVPCMFAASHTWSWR
jgi:hypothetical protein